MASKPWLDPRRREWLMKYRPTPGGPWVRVKLCKHEGPMPSPDAKRKPKPPVEAERRAREFEEIEYRAARGLGAAPPQVKSLKDYLDAFAESRALSSAPGSSRMLRFGIDRFVAFAAKAGVTTLQGVTRALCREFLEDRARDVKHSTLQAERGYLMGAWTQALGDELIASNPWTGTKPPGRPSPTSITFWSAGEIASIAAACKEPWQSDIVLFMANTGLRISTALACRWSWLDPAGRILSIGRAPGVKTTYVHVLSAAARSVLARRKGQGGGSALVFSLDGRSVALSYERAADAIEAAILKAGARGGTPHDFRHSYGRALALAGVPVTVIMKQMGHTSLKTTMKYLTVEQEDVGRFVEDFDLGRLSPRAGDGT